MTPEDHGQATGAAVSDVERDDWIAATTDKAHAENWAGIHTSGFCRACANVYTALNHAATEGPGR